MITRRTLAGYGSKPLGIGPKMADGPMGGGMGGGGRRRLDQNMAPQAPPPSPGMPPVGPSVSANPTATPNPGNIGHLTGEPTSGGGATDPIMRLLQQLMEAGNAR